MLLLIAIACSSHAACTPAQVNAFVRSLPYPANADVPFFPRSALVDCKTMPDDTQRSLVAVLAPAQADMQHIEIAVIDASGAVQVRQQMPAGPGVETILLDTLHYPLAANIHAIGVVSQYHFERDGRFATTLSLLLPESGTLRPVLSNLQTGEFDPALVPEGADPEASQCMDDMGQPQLVGTATGYRRSLSVAASASAGFADLIVKETDRSQNMTKQGGNCVDTGHHHPAKTLLLHYDGKGYALPADLGYEPGSRAVSRVPGAQ